MLFGHSNKNIINGGNKLKKLFTALIMVALILSLPATALAAEPTAADYQRMFGEVLEFVKDGYAFGDELTEKELFEAAMKGMFDQIDPYSEFLTPEEGEAFSNSLQSAYVGIGVVLKQTNEYVSVAKVFPESPAEKAGVQKGDYFINVDGQDTMGFTPSQIQGLVLGEEGTEVTIVFGRGGTSYTATIVRGRVNAPSVESLDIKELMPKLTEEQANKIGYIAITSFSDETDKEFKKEIERIKARGINQLVLDLRDNGGGYVTTAVEAAREIIPKGQIVSFVNSQNQKKSYNSSLENPPFEIVALINENSASATEFVAAAIQDSKVGSLVGETTYGKGVSQFYFTYQFGYDIKLTMEEFFSRDNKKIHEVGVTPDYYVEIPDFLVGTTRYYINDTNESVKNIEQILKYLGYDIAEPDDFFDLNTFEALKIFQRNNKLYPYGVCDLTTQNKLNDALYNSIEAYDPQLSKAVSLILDKTEK